MSDRTAIQSAYADFIAGFEWYWFCTLTFRDPPHPESAEKRFRFWIHKINQLIYGRRYRKRGQGIYWILALEYHKSDAIHLHALLADTEDLNARFRRQRAKAMWFEIAGLAKVEKIANSKAVTRYVSKYVSKGGELTFGPGLQNYARQLPVGIHST